MSYTFGSRNYNVPDNAMTTAQQILTTSQTQASKLVTSAQAAINTLGSTSLPMLPAPPAPVSLEVPATPFQAAKSIPTGADVGIDIPKPGTPGTPMISTSDISVDVPEFNASVSLNIPAAPGALDTSGMPVRPSVDTNITLPAAPALSLPANPSLEDILVPDFHFPELPAFDGTPPDFTGATPNVALDWHEPVYFSETLDDIRAKVRAIFAGGTGLPPAVEQALFDSARSREEVQVKKSVQEAFDTFAGRGFNMPPGMLVAQVNAAREDGQMKINNINRDIMTEAAKWQLESLKMAVEQGIAAENLMVQQFNNGLNRQFEAAKAVIEGHISLYNATVGLYNARQQGYQVAAQVYKTEIDAKLSQIEVYKAEIEGVRIRGERNEQRVRTYTAQLQAVAQTVDIYRAQMEGAKTEADVAKAIIESYRTDVEAYSAKLQAEKTKFEAYESAVRGEVAKAQILDVDARVFATRMQGASTQADIKAKMVEAEIASMNASTQRYIAELERAKVDIQEASLRVTAKLGMMEANARWQTVADEAARATNEAAIRIGEQKLQARIEQAKIGVSQYQAASQNAIEQARLHVTAIQGASQAASTLAAGAMAAVHVGANVSSSFSNGYSIGFTESGQESTTTSRRE